MKTKVLIIGATGKVGGETLRLLREIETIEPIAAVRSPEKVNYFKNIGVKARFVDLDNPSTLSPALNDIERTLILTGYTVDMLRQSKRFLDTAKIQGVQHIVHIGASGATTNEVAHWGWHQFVEAYIEKLGFNWTHLRPEAYMQNITGPGYRWLEGDTITNFIGEAIWSWVDCLDVAAVAVEALAFPEKYNEKIIPLGYDAQNMANVAAILSEAIGRRITLENVGPEAFLENAITGGADPAYMQCVYTQFKLDAAGKIPGAGTVFNNFESIVGRPPATWITFAQRVGHTL